MKKYLFLFFIAVGFIFSYKTFADEVEQKTDGSFVGENPPAPINSSFVGDISNSTVNESWGQEDVAKKTDGAFAGRDPGENDSSDFAGDNFDRAQQENKDTPFAQGNAFIGEDYGK